MITLFTNRYQAFQPVQGVPVRITRGAPRFRLGYRLSHHIPVLAPRGEYFRETPARFAEAYRSDLSKAGHGRIADILNGIAETEQEHRLVLLCFEDLSQPGQWCHRRIFASWWKEATGDEVREIGPMADHWTQGELI